MQLSPTMQDYRARCNHKRGQNRFH